MNDAQKYLLNNGCDDLILNDRKCTKVEDRLYSSDMMMEFARSYHDKLSKLHQPTVSGRSEQLCQCKDAPTKHFIKNWCDDCKKHIV
jgi:hypothetical protein